MCTHGYTHSMLATGVIFKENRGSENGTLDNKNKAHQRERDTMPRNKTAQVHLRYTPEEKEQLEVRAAEARLSMSQYLLALSEQKKIIVADGLPELCRQIMKIGTNVNQIALVANTHKTVSEKQLDAVNDSLMDVKNLLIKLIDTIQNSKDEIKV